jgi:hypothetical protein
MLSAAKGVGQLARPACEPSAGHRPGGDHPDLGSRRGAATSASTAAPSARASVLWWFHGSPPRDAPNRGSRAHVGAWVAAGPLHEHSQRDHSESPIRKMVRGREPAPVEAMDCERATRVASLASESIVRDRRRNCRKYRRRHTPGIRGRRLSCGR